MFRISLAIIIGFTAFLWLNNSSLFVQRDDALNPRLIAHRGVHQTFAGAVQDRDGCTAYPIHPIQHQFIENTIPSMGAAFDAGAEVVELDIHLTPDQTFAVFHDWTLDCRTDGNGQTNETLFEDLRKLDVGYGYSVDGRTFPLRGTGVGLIPSLTEVFKSFPEGRFLINFKSNRQEEGEVLARYLREIPAVQGQVFGVYGGQKPTRAVLGEVAGLRGFDNSMIKSCYARYALYGWTGLIPKVCQNRLLPVPINYAWLFWGWPDRFQKRMESMGTSVILLGPYQDGRQSGLDNRELLNRIPEQFNGYIWTDKVEEVGPLLQ